MKRSEDDKEERLTANPINLVFSPHGFCRGCNVLQGNNYGNMLLGWKHVDKLKRRKEIESCTRVKVLSQNFSWT